MHEYTKAEASYIASKVTDQQKRHALGQLSEDDFRDRVVRPLYRRLGLKHLRENHGVDELGKDCIFLAPDPMGGEMVYGIQTKTGPVSMAGTTPSHNLSVIEAQLQMALNTPVLLADNATKLKPAQVHLCTTGRISNSARTYLNEKFETHRIKLYGADELIEFLDRSYPEFWLDIDSDRFPYIRELRRRLCVADDVIRVGKPTETPGQDSPIVDGNYLRLRLSRMEQKITHVNTTRVLPTGEKIHVTEPRPSPKFVDIAVEALIDQRSRLSLITGEGGSGKTTALRRVAMTLIDGVLENRADAKLPVVLRAKQVAMHGGKLTELMAAEAAAISGVGSPFSANDLATGKVVVLVDALENVDDSLRENAVQCLLDFHEEYPECAVVMTARDYRSVLELASVARFVTYWLMPVGLGEMDHLITRFIDKKPVDHTLAKTTLKRLTEYHGMNLSPMLITVFLSSADFSKQDLPPNIAEIFRKFTEHMIGRWDEQKGIEQQYESNTKDFLLRQLAFQMHASRVRSIPREDVMRLFDAELAKRDLGIDRQRLATEVIDRSGLFRLDGLNVEWRHHLLQEYFAGRGVPSPDFFEGVASEEWWRTPMMFYFGDQPQAFAALWKIVESTGALQLAALFDAAVSIGLATQACYLAEIDQKVKAFTWVVEAMAKSMDAFRGAFDASEGGDKDMMAQCVMLCLGRDAIGTRTIAKVPKGLSAPLGAADALFQPIDPERTEAWRIVGLLESGEFDIAAEAIRPFRPKNRDLTFMVHLSVAWTLYAKEPSTEQRKALDHYLTSTAEIVADLKAKLFQELKTLFFRVNDKAKLTPIMPAIAEEKSKPSGA